MKFQDIILRAIAKKITWVDAAEIAGVSPRTMDSIRHKYEIFGYDGLFEQMGRRRFRRWVPFKTTESVLSLYETSYAGFGVRRFRSKLQTEHGIRLSYGWLRQALEGAGLIHCRKKHPQVLPEIAQAGEN